LHYINLSMPSVFPGRIIDSVNGFVGKVKLLILKTVSFNPTTPYLLEFKDQDGNLLDSEEVHIENVKDLQTTLDTKLEEADVTDLNDQVVKHNIIQIGSTIIGETVTTLKPSELNGNFLTIKLQAENGIIQEDAIDLSNLNTTKSGVTNATYNASTNIILLTEADGTEHEINLSEFSILRSVDANGVVTLWQEGVIKATISKVGESGEFADLLGKPTTLATYGITDAYTKVEVDGKIFKYLGQLTSSDSIDTILSTGTQTGFYRIRTWSGGSYPPDLPSDFVFESNTSTYTHLLFTTDGTTRNVSIMDTAGNIYRKMRSGGAWIKNKATYDDTAVNNSINDHINNFNNPHGVTWAQLGSKPTTISGFGITDAYTATVIDSKLDDKVDDTRVLTDVPSGAVFTDTTYNNLNQLATRDYNDLQNKPPIPDPKIQLVRIKIKESDLPTDYTEDDILEHLNTTGGTKYKLQNILWEAGDFKDTLTIVSPTEGQVYGSEVTEITMSITIT
jgi:hypothetical protein